MEGQKRLRIAYLSSADPKDMRSWSGTHHSVFTSLQKYCGDVTALGPFLPKRQILAGHITSFLLSRLFGKRFDYTHSRKVAKAFGQFFSEKIDSGKYDLIFAVAASSELAYLSTNVPVYYLADATFANMIGYYPFYTNLTKRSVQEGNEVQKLALQKATRLYFPSKWAADSAVNDYGVSRDKISILPLGANMKEVPSPAIRNREVNDKSIRLLFIGVEWERKGGPVAVEALRELRNLGFDAKLTVVGCTPQINEVGIEIIAFINKNEPGQREVFLNLFRKSDFLILPTTAECFGLVFCEASAMGIPSLASDTGGVNGVVKSGINGYLLPSDATGKDYAQQIIAIINDPGKYASLSASSRALYDQELNWDAWGKAVAQEINGFKNQSI